MNALPAPLSAAFVAPDPVVRGFGPAMMAIAALATMASGAAVTLDRQAARLVEAASQITIAVRDADPRRQSARARAVARMLARRTDLRDVRPVRAATLRAELAGWSDESADTLPALIDATLVAGTDAPEGERALGRALAGQAGVTVTRGAADLLPIAAARRRLGRSAAIVALAALAGGVATTVAAARALSIQHAASFAVWRRLGARDAQIARPLQWRAGECALRYGGGGALLGAAAILFSAGQVGGFEGEAVVGSSTSASGWPIAIAIPLLLATSAVVATRLVLLRSLRLR